MNNEQELIRRAQRGDGEAFRQLVEAYQTQVYRLALRMCGESAADDVTQEAFLAAWRALPDFRGDCRVSTWRYRLTTNAGIDWLRREKRHRSADDVTSWSCRTTRRRPRSRPSSRRRSPPSAGRCPACRRSTGRCCCCGTCRSWITARSPRRWTSARAR